MELIQFDLTGRGQPDIAETIYDSLHGFLIPACSLPWVEPVFQPGHPSHDSYEQMLQIKDRLAEDADLDALVDCALPTANPLPWKCSAADSSIRRCWMKNKRHRLSGVFYLL